MKPSLTRGALQLALTAVMSMMLVPAALKAQEAQIQELGNQARNSARPLTRLVIASANVKIGVSLERLSLVSGEGNTGKKVLSGLLAGAAAIAGVKGDFADREPIEEHLSLDDANRIGAEALEIVAARLRAAGFEVVGPEVVAAAPFYAAVKGDDKVATDNAKQDGGMFKKGYYYGFYKLPMAGLKYREMGLLTIGFGDDELFPKARAAAADAPAALDLNLALVNDKKNFFLFDATARVWAPMPGRSGDVALLNETLKNKDDFSVPSGGKDTYAYWTSFKPKFELVAGALAAKLADGARSSVKDGSAWPAPKAPPAAAAAPVAAPEPAASAAEPPATPAAAASAAS